MNDQTDSQLLRAYAEHRSEAAFAELVRRHLDFVYSAALRMVCDSYLAEDVAQGVFVALAKNAAQLTNRPVLAGWLHRTAQNIAAQTVRTDVRRRAREQEAAAMNELLSVETDATWDRIAPHLDSALGELSEPDRDALLLRYFERKSAREMAAALGTSEEAAQKRVNRAVERLREFFAKRGVTAGAGGLVAVISANAVQAAPVGLVLTITTSAALVGTTVAAVTTSTAAQAIAMTTLQKTLVAATLAIAIGVGLYENRQAAQLRGQIDAIRQAQAANVASTDAAALSRFQARIDLLTAQNAELAATLAQANSDKARLEAEHQQASRSAKLFKELADRADLRDRNSTNEYPTERHVMAGLGRMARLSVQAKKREGDNLSPEEKAAHEAMLMNMAMDALNLMKAAKRFDLDKPSGKSPADDDRADKGTCLLYGALNLNEHQFGGVYSVLQQYQMQAGQKGLLVENPPAETTAALKEVDEQAKSQIKTLLTSEQAATFEEMLPQIQVITGGGGNADFNFSFGGQPKKEETGK